MLNTLPDIFSFRELHFFEPPVANEDNQALPVDEAAQLYAMLEETQENGILNIPQKMPQKNRMGTVQQVNNLLKTPLHRISTCPSD